MYAVNLVIFSIVVLKKADKICPKIPLKTIAVNSGKNNQRLQPINAAKRKKKKKKKDKTTTTTNHKKTTSSFCCSTTHHSNYNIK